MNTEKKEICNRINNNTRARYEIEKVLKSNRIIKWSTLALFLIFSVGNIGFALSPQIATNDLLIMIDFLATLGLGVSHLGSIITEIKLMNKNEDLKSEFDIDILKLEKMNEKEFEKTNNKIKQIDEVKFFNECLEEVKNLGNAKVKVYKK